METKEKIIKLIEKKRQITADEIAEDLGASRQAFLIPPQFPI